MTNAEYEPEVHLKRTVKPERGLQSAAMSNNRIAISLLTLGNRALLRTDVRAPAVWELTVILRCGPEPGGGRTLQTSDSVARCLAFGGPAGSRLASTFFNSERKLNYGFEQCT